MSPSLQCHGEKNWNEFETPKFGDVEQIISCLFRINSRWAVSCHLDPKMS